MKNDAGIEIFEGFKIKYPEYSVITPQTLREFTIRTLTVSEEEVLKSSMLTPNKLASHLNKVIFDCLTKKPDDIKTYDDFLNKLTVKDRDALMFGLYHATYKDIQNYEITCASCNAQNSVKINFEKSFKAVMWPKDDVPVLDKEVKVPLEIAKNITAVLKQTRLVTEDSFLSDAAFASDEVRDMQLQLLIIDRFEVDPGGKNPIVTYEDRDNIYEGYKQLPSTDRKLIEKAYADNFGKYGTEIKADVICQKCGARTSVTIDLVRQFFRAMYQ